MIGAQPALSRSAQQAASEVRAVFSRLRRRLRETYSDDGLTPSQTAVLIRLAKEGPATTSELATAERVRPQSMATTLAAMDAHCGERERQTIIAAMALLDRLIEA